MNNMPTCLPPIIHLVDPLYMASTHVLVPNKIWIYLTKAHDIFDSQQWNRVQDVGAGAIASTAPWYRVDNSRATSRRLNAERKILKGLQGEARGICITKRKLGMGEEGDGHQSVVPAQTGDDRDGTLRDYSFLPVVWLKVSERVSIAKRRVRSRNYFFS
jgi:hypothetical protein